MLHHHPQRLGTNIVGELQPPAAIYLQTCTCCMPPANQQAQWLLSMIAWEAQISTSVDYLIYPLSASEHSSRYGGSAFLCLSHNVWNYQ